MVKNNKTKVYKGSRNQNAKCGICDKRWTAGDMRTLNKSIELHKKLNHPETTQFNHIIDTPMVRLPNQQLPEQMRLQN